MGINELKERFLSLSILDRNELLKCFVEAYYYNEELIEEGFYKRLYKKLTSIYKPITEDKKALDLLRGIKNNDIESTMENLSLILIEQIMMGVKGNIGVDKAVLDMLFDYHLRFNKSFINKIYNSKIKDSIGDDVFVVEKKSNKPVLENGILNDAKEDNVSINNKDINKSNIIKIENAKKKVIYYNNLGKDKAA